MIVGAANIRLGAIVSGFINGFNQAGQGVRAFTRQANADLATFYRAQDNQSRVFNKGLGRMASDMQGFGRAITTYIAAPLAIAGGVMFNTYAEIDGMQRGLKVFAGSAQVAGAQFNLFREAAKLPGLGLEEAVQGGLRLEALGYNATTATRYMKEFGNAIALGGGGKVQFDAVLTQLTQMSGKSKVLAEDLKPIVNASPAIAKAITDMFGTVDSEQISAKLQAAGKGPKDFIDMLVNQLGKLERVSGGPKNAIENIQDSLKVASFEFGKAADQTFGLTTKLEGLGASIEGAATGFASMSSPTKATILGVTGMVAALGPLSLGIGTLIKMAPQLKMGLDALKLGFVTLVNPITVTIAALAAIGVAAYSLYNFNKEIQVTVDKQKLLSESTAQAKQQIAGETGLLESLLKVARDEKATKEQRLKAIRELNAISPKYLGDLNLETINTQKATQALAQYTRVLTLKAQAQVFANKLAEAEAKVAEESNVKAAERVDWMDRLGAGFNNMFVGGKKFNEEFNKDLAAKGAEKQAAALGEARQTADFYKKSLDGVVASLAKMGETATNTAIVPDFTGNTGKKASGPKSWKEYSPADIAKNAVKDLDNEIKSLELTGKSFSTLYNERIEKLKEYKGVWMDLMGITSGKTALPDADALKPKKAPYQAKLETNFNAIKGWKMDNAFDAINPGIQKLIDTQALQAQFDHFKVFMGKGMKDIADLGEQYKGIAVGFGQSIQDASISMAESLSGGFGEMIGGLISGQKGALQQFGKLMVESIAAMLAQMGKAKIAAGTMLLAASLFPPNPVGMAAGKKSIASGIALNVGAGAIRAIGSAINIPRLAKGGIAYGNSIVNVAEYAGASNNPEVIAPLDRLKDIIGGGGTTVVEGEFVLRGDDLYRVIKRMAKKEGDR
ncbi:tape measure protein [Tellurirhabdus bombi]|uniref:tape measure protein n=1 Tax=Tellurirhabdus bombi TaxID=2907205 RepID=UPI001F27C5ED|nr:tape measure protein [Tellurirhabdus bombi]